MKLQNLSLHLALFTIMISGPLWGAWHAPVVFWLMLLSLFALGLHCLYKLQNERPLITNWLIILPALSILFTLSMIVPIPVNLHAILSPDSSADLQKAYVLLGQHPKTLFLSLAPRETAIRFMQLLTALALFLIISDQAKHERAQKLIFDWILAGALLFLLIALHHRPMVNQNNVARIFGIFSLLCAVQFQESKAPFRQALFGLTAILCGVSIYMTPSRWGMISFSICLLFFLKSWKLKLGIISAFVLVASGIALSRLSSLADPETWWVKIELLGYLPGILQRHWISGIGQGALSLEYYKQVWPDFNANPLFSYYYVITHLENTTLQTLVDHGLIKGLILWSLAIWAFMLVAKTRPNLLPVFLFVWIGDFSDFAFESGTVLYLCTLTLALCPINFKLKLSPRKLTTAFAGTLVLAGLATPLVWKQNQVNYLNPNHAYAHSMINPPHSKAWLDYTLTRRPTFFGAHMMLARWHWNQRNYTQARQEYRLAAASYPGYLYPILEEATLIAPHHRELLPNESPEALKIWLDFALKHQYAGEALEALQTLTQGQAPKDGQTALWFAQILILQQGLEKTVEQTNNWGKDLQKPCPFLAWRLWALSHTNKTDQALREFEPTKDCLDNWEITLADLYEQNGQPAKARELIRSLLRANPGDKTLMSRLP